MNSNPLGFFVPDKNNYFLGWVAEEALFVHIYAAFSNCHFELYLMGSGSLSDEPPAVEVDEQPGRERLLLHPGEAGHRDGGRILP